jgi:hypothetical protein
MMLARPSGMATWTTILSLSVFLLAACAAGSTGPRDDQENSRVESDPLIRTDRQVYTAKRGTSKSEDGTVVGRFVELTIPLRYTNFTGNSIYLPTCLGVNPPVLEKKQGSEWVVAYSPAVPACLGPPQVIEPGKTFDYVYQVEGYLPGGNTFPQFETSVPGTYRIVWGAYGTWTPTSTEPGLGRELPLAKRVSNEFGVVE